ncbi:hypothetical protein EG329_006077 [Mollisiaceae sp. DMI_Dod_QoI]|nr:hypothetical protein EG329_006077 [Helotiales sp. DMI_Dod_QoI]
MLAVTANKSPNNEDNKSGDRANMSRSKKIGQNLQGEPINTSHEKDTGLTKEYSSKEWRDMRPDIKLDSTKSSNLNGQLEEMRSWFRVGEGHSSMTNPNLSAKGTGTSDNTLYDSTFRSNDTETLPLEAESSLESPSVGLFSSGGILEELGTVVKKLMDQNEKLVLKLAAAEQVRKSLEEIAFKDLEQDTNPLLPYDKTAENLAMTLDDLKSLNAEAKKEVQVLEATNKHLKGELSKTQEELKTKATLLWDQGWDLRDCQTKVEKLNAQLMNSMSIDDMATIDIPAKTLLESIQEKDIEFLTAAKKRLERRVENLELEIVRLKGKEVALGQIGMKHKT